MEIFIAFQAYFAARYTIQLTDEDQKKLFYMQLSHGSRRGENDYLYLLEEMDKSRFEKNALEDGIRDILKKAKRKTFSDEFFVKLIGDGISIFEDHSPYLNIKSCGQDGYLRNVYYCFGQYVYKKPLWHIVHVAEEKIVNIVDHLSETHGDSRKKTQVTVDFEQIDSSEQLDEQMRHDFYTSLSECRKIPEISKALTDWLAEIDARKEMSQTESFIDSL